MKQILLADDDAAIRETLGEVLVSEQYELIYAATGREAAAKFATYQPDLVLLDLNMPDGDGWSAFDLICNAHPVTPVIIITAISRQYPRAAELGVDALMEKPLDIPLLLKTIRNYLAESEAERVHRLTRPDFKTALLTNSAHHDARRRTSEVGGTIGK